MKERFSKLWLDFKKDRRSILVYVLISGLMWVISVLLMGDYGWRYFTNVHSVAFAALGGAAGFRAVSRFLHLKNDEDIGDGYDSVSLFGLRVATEMLKVILSVIVTSVLLLIFSYLLEIELYVYLKGLLSVIISTVMLYCSLGAFAGMVAERIVMRVVVCLTYYFLSAGLTLFVFGFKRELFEPVAVYVSPFVYNAPLLNYSCFEIIGGGCLISNSLNGFFSEVGITVQGFIGMLITSILFFALACILFKYRETPLCEAVARGVTEVAQMFFAVECYFIFAVRPFCGDRASRIIEAAQDRFDRFLPVAVIIDLILVVVIYIVTSAVCRCKNRGTEGRMKPWWIPVILAFLLWVFTFVSVG